MKRAIFLILFAFLFLYTNAQHQWKTINPSGSGPDNFTSITAAVNWLNSSYTGTDGVTFELAGNTTFIEDIPSITFQGSVTNYVNFWNFSKTAIIKRLTGGTTYDAIISLEGADYIKFYGLVFSDEGQGIAERGITIFSPSGTNNGCNNISFEYCTIKLDPNNPNACIGIHQTVNGTPTASSAANSNILYKNLTIENVNYCGIYLNGKSPYPDQNITIEGGNNEGLIIGSSSANNIGGSTGGYGIFATYQSNLSIKKCLIRNITSSGNAEGLHIENIYGTTSIEKNKIYNVKCSNTAPTSQIAYGMNIAMNNGGQMQITNNMISNISHDISTENAGLWVRGIGISSSHSGNFVNIMFNSVLINEDNLQSTACFAIPNVPVSGIFECNKNIFANTSTSGATSIRWGLYFGT